MTLDRISLSSAILFIVLHACVRAYNFPSFDLDPRKQIFNSYFPTIQIEPSLLIRKLCLSYKWPECSDSQLSGAPTLLNYAYDRNVQPLYQSGSHLTRLTSPPNTKQIQTKATQPRRPLFGNNVQHFSISPDILQNRRSFYNVPVNDLTQSTNNVEYHSFHTSKTIENFENVLPNQSVTIAATEDYNDDVNKSFINDTEIQSEKLIMKSGHKMSSFSDKTLTSEHTETNEIYATGRHMDSVTLSEKFLNTLDNFERKFYEATFIKLSSISPADRQENGISFIQSGLLLYLMLTILSMEADPKTKLEIQDYIGFNASDTEKLQIIKQVMTTLPESSDNLRFRLKSRLLVAANLTCDLRTEIASVAQLDLHRFNITDTPEELTRKLNHMVEVDSGGAMYDTFDESDLSEGVRAVLMSTVYVRARWRSAPTLLNGTHLFHDAEGAPKRSVRMLRVNDVMRYADLRECDAEAIEIPYGTPELSLLLLVPRGRSLRKLSELFFKTPFQNIINTMHTMRVAVSIPLYTLRMTLLLPNKLQFMGISHIVDTTDDVTNGTLRLSHAVQRLMFWAEAGRNAFKDDGVEWDERPEMELMVDRPYMFFVRWKNITLINGNFVL